MNTLSFARKEVLSRDLISLKDGLGDLVWERLHDVDVFDIMLNGDGALFEDRRGHGLTRIGTINEYDAQSAINIVTAIAGEVVDRKSPIIEAELPVRKARFIGYSPPITAKPSFSIRLPPSKIYTLAEYVADGIATTAQVAVIENAIAAGQNILIAGGTGSGKSTLLNAVLEALSRIHPVKRVCLIEEVIELQCSQANVLALRTGPQADHQDLLMRLMRSRPDVIVFGEVRDEAALQLVKAANTGHDGLMSTLHANSAQDALHRMQDLCAEAEPGDFRSQIASAFDLIVGIQRTNAADRKPGDADRRITEIIKLEGFADNAYKFAVLA